jgi:hypothetical protein
MRPRWCLETARGFGSGGASRGGGSPVLQPQKLGKELAKDGDTAARACPCPKAPEWVVSQVNRGPLRGVPCEKRAPYRLISAGVKPSGNRGLLSCPADAQTRRCGIRPRRYGRNAICGMTLATGVVEIATRVFREYLGSVIDDLSAAVARSGPGDTGSVSRQCRGARQLNQCGLVGLAGRSIFVFSGIF